MAYWEEDSVKATPKLTIVMSTYNGATYIGAQLESLIAQNFTEWSLLVRDDGSSDDTVKIVEAFAERDRRIRRLVDSAGNLKPARSFFRLLAAVDSPFFMCCDQDDVWLPHKVQEAVEFLEREDSTKPRLFFTDLKVVNAGLAPIASSFMSYQKFDPHRSESFRGLLMQNVIVGCSLAGNRALLAVTMNSRFGAMQSGLMHDWWLGLVAAAFGKIGYSSKPSILYRQHSNNSLGAPGSNLSRYVYLTVHAKPWKKASVYLSKVAQQSNDFKSIYGDLLAPDQIEDLDRIVKLGSTASVRPLFCALSSGLKMHGSLRNFALLLSVLVCPTSRNGYRKFQNANPGVKQ
jgi:glycosyltransferase involved in cell wall biosynthesis